MREDEIPISLRAEGEYINEGVTITDTNLSKYVRIREGNVIYLLKFEMETGRLVRAVKQWNE